MTIICTYYFKLLIRRVENNQILHFNFENLYMANRYFDMSTITRFVGNIEIHFEPITQLSFLRY